MVGNQQLKSDFIGVSECVNTIETYTSKSHLETLDSRRDLVPSSGFVNEHVVLLEQQKKRGYEGRWRTLDRASSAMRSRPSSVVSNLNTTQPKINQEYTVNGVLTATKKKLPASYESHRKNVRIKTKDSLSVDVKGRDSR